MTLYQSLYFMSLAGGMAGLLSWALSSIICSFISFSGAPDFVSPALLGCLIGAFTIGFAERWSGIRVGARWIWWGALTGLIAGIVGALANLPIRALLVAQQSVLARTIAWMIVGSFVGLGLGLRWLRVNPARMAHAFTGGLCGGLVGGLLFATVGNSFPQFTEAFGYILVGAGICFGVAFAPILLRQGLLQFVSSGDPRAQSKLGRNRKQWELQEGDIYVIGAKNPGFGETRYGPDIPIFIPDSSMASRHARLFVKEGRYYLERHPEIRGTAAVARYVLRVRGKSVSATYELKDSDDIVVGRTTLRFLTRKRAA
jgi:MFS family permease